MMKAAQSQTRVPARGPSSDRVTIWGSSTSLLLCFTSRNGEKSRGKERVEKKGLGVTCGKMNKEASEQRKHKSEREKQMTGRKRRRNMGQRRGWECQVIGYRARLERAEMEQEGVGVESDMDPEEEKPEEGARESEHQVQGQRWLSWKAGPRSQISSAWCQAGRSWRDCLSEEAEP